MSYDNILIELYDEWMDNKNRWFSKKETIDIYLSNKYIKYIDSINQLDVIKTNDKKVIIGYIILLDQITRHYNRIKKIDINYYTSIACVVSFHFLNNLKQNNNLSISPLTSLSTLTAHDKCFIYMPHRHMKDIEMISDIIEIFKNFYIESYKTNNLEDTKIYKSYFFNTIKNSYSIISADILKKQIDDKNLYSYEINSNFTEFNHILDNCPKEVLETNPDIIKDPLLHNFDINPYKNIIVSLSGGVDSMLCLYILKHYLCNICKTNIIAAHINYNNREECDEEVKFLKKYCDCLNIPFVYRRIDELNRQECIDNGLRDIYESITKDIRFDFYKQIANNYFNDIDNTFIVLGHNKDDCFENILTNINYKKNYDNLSGMSIHTKINTINFWRPLLEIDKTAIYNYAKRFNIPYLCDSTPKWSMRGIIRDTVKPAMLAISPNIINTFFDLKDKMQADDYLIKEYIIKDIKSKFINVDETMSIILNLDNLFIKMHDNILLCKNLWYDILNSDSINKKRISHKAVYEFVFCINKFINNKTNSKKKFILRNDVYSEMNIIGKDIKITIVF
jgi:tRNA(Ile)-lysidine synthetase-like protein